MIWMLLVLARRTSGWHRARALRRLAPRCAAHFAPLPEETTTDVLNYWFTEEARQRWFASTAAFDRRVADKRKQLAAPAAGEGAAAEAPRKRARPEDSSPPQVSQDWNDSQDGLTQET